MQPFPSCFVLLLLHDYLDSSYLIIMLSCEQKRIRKQDREK